MSNYILGDKTPLTDFVTDRSCLSMFEIDKIREIFDEEEKSNIAYQARTGDDYGTIDQSKRSSIISWIEPNYIEKHRCSDVVDKINAQVNSINDHFFKFDLLTTEPLQVTKYYSKTNDFFVPHTDNGAYQENIVRKLTFVIQLSDLDEFEGGDFIYYSDGKEINVTQLYPERMQKGNIIIFPSFVTHAVTPITNGTRYALVGWCNGPRFR
jgi:PKHD-type hydroxylase